MEGPSRRGPRLPRHCYLTKHQGETPGRLPLAAAATVIPTPTVQLYERRSSDYVYFCGVKYIQEGLDWAQPAMHLTDYYSLLSSLVRYFGPKSGGHLYGRPPSLKSGGRVTSVSPCGHAHGCQAVVRLSLRSVLAVFLIP